MKFLKIMFLAGVLALVTAGSVPATVLAEYGKGDGDLGSNGNRFHDRESCSSVYFNYEHDGTPTGVYISTHTLTDGRICTITHMSYVHSMICTSCKGSMGLEPFYCTDHHSICRDSVPSCKLR